MGFGNIGIELSKRLRPFGVKILATKRNWASYDLNSLDSSGNALHITCYTCSCVLALVVWRWKNL